MENISDIITTWKELNHFTPLLPILEYKYSEILEYISKSNNNKLKNSLGSFVSFSLEQSQYWSDLALIWIENGFEITEDIIEKLIKLSKNKYYSQNSRHRALKIIKTNKSV